MDGRKRGVLEMPINSKEIMIIKKSKEIDNVSKHIENTTIIKNIYVENKLVNFITKKWKKQFTLFSHLYYWF